MLDRTGPVRSDLYRSRAGLEPVVADYNNDLKNTIVNYSKLPPSPWTLKLVPYWLSGEGQQRFPLIRELALETASIPATAPASSASSA